MFSHPCSTPGTGARAPGKSNTASALFCRPFRIVFLELLPELRIFVEREVFYFLMFENVYAYNMLKWVLFGL